MISLLCPTRKRPDNVKRLVESVFATAKRPNDVELVFYVDDDDDTFPLDGKVKVVRGPRIVLSQMWNRCYDVARGDVLMHCGDDIVFRTPMWDVEVWRQVVSVPDRIVLVHANDGSPWSARLATHSFLTRRWVETVGQFVPPIFSAEYNDTWLTEVADMVGRRRYLPHVLIEHMHWAFSKAPMDGTYAELQRRRRRDRVDELYQETINERLQWAAKLREVME